MREELIATLQENKVALYRVALSYVHTEAEALDIVQTTAEKALRQVNQVQESRYLKTWLFRVLINTAIDAQRKQARRHEVGDESLEFMPALTTIEPEMRLALNEAVADLTAKEQAIICLHFFENQTFADIALTLELSENTVKTTYYRSLKKLEAALNGGM
ncbi:RNA polymerase sigma factor [Weissella confusa]